MIKLLIILSLCFVFAGELEVDGDLTVTGNIQNQTIESLQQVIAELQAQIVAMQVDNKMETRIFETQILSNGESFNLFTDLNEPINPLDFYFLEIIDINGITVADYNLNNATQFYIQLHANGGRQHAAVNLFLYNGTPVVGNNYYYNSNGYESLSRGLFTSGGVSLTLPPNHNNLLSCSLTLAITANFSNAPTVQAPEPPQNSRTDQ